MHAAIASLELANYAKVILQLLKLKLGTVLKCCIL